MVPSRIIAGCAALAVTLPFPARSAAPSSIGHFDRVATFEVAGDVAEIVTSTPDGRLLAYTDSDVEQLGFVDITNPVSPVELAPLPVAGEPTSIATTPDGRWFLAVVDGSPSQLLVIDATSRAVVRAIALAGQPDSIAIGPSGRFAAIAIENQRDESVNGGRMPQFPAGFLTIVDLVGAPAAWTLRDVALTGLATLFPEDPEPEFVDVNASDIAAVTMQENNHVVLVDLASGAIAGHFSAGTTSHLADLVRNNDALLVDGLVDARREPDGITWTPDGRIVTANEGDYNVDLAPGQFVGGRDFTIFSADGAVVFEPGESLEAHAIRHGHYPEARSNSKGAEHESVEVGRFGSKTFLFVGSERGSYVGVYQLADERAPEFVQLLPTGVAPEGLLAIPSRGLFVTSNEGDGTLSIFAGAPGVGNADYPQVVSASSDIWWSAMSGIDVGADGIAYAVPDSAVKPSRIFTLELGRKRSEVKSSLRLPVSLDLEGIAVRPQGGWWVVSEGARSFGQSGRTQNLLVRVNTDGSIAEQVTLPAQVDDKQVQFGFEGVTTSLDGSDVYVVFQREWTDDPFGFVKIGRYTPATATWAFFRYPLDAAPAGGWVGLSEIERIDDSTFLILERDNQAGSAAQVKRVYSVSIAGLEPAPAGTTPTEVAKTLVRDLLAQDAWTLEKVEGMSVTPSGRLLLLSDNDGVGETRMLTLRNW